METTREANLAQGALEYRAEIDSLRALAIIPVVLFHLWPTVLPGGFLGVDVFFVLSGYLISKILLRDLDAGCFRMRRFYARRVRRLVPVIVSVVTATLLVATVYLTDLQRVYIAQQSVAALLSISNFFVWQSTGDYWGPTAEGTALLHTWSLSVEEQFYLLYPLLLALAHRWIPKRVTALLMLIAVSSGLLYWIVIAARPDAAFYLLPTRAWELACGGLLASLERDSPDRVATEGHSERVTQTPGNAILGAELMRSGIGCVIGLFMIALAYCLPSESRSNESATTIATAGAMLFLATPRDANVFRYLSLAGLVYIGRISYSWYMWHWPILVLNELTGLYASKWIVGVAGFVAAVVSYHLIEQTTRRRKGILRWILAAFCGAMVVALFSLLPRPVEPADPSLYKPCRWYGRYYNAYPEGETSDWYRQVINEATVPVRQSSGDEYESGGIRFGGSEPPQVVLLGDSHATMWAHLIHRLTVQRGRTLSVWAINGMDPLFGQAGRNADPDSIKGRYDAARKEKLAQWHPELTILSMRWSWRDPARLGEFVEFVASCSDQVLLIGPTPELRIGDQNVRSYLIESGITPSEDHNHYLPAVKSDAVLAAPELVQRLAAAFPNVQVVTVEQRYQRARGVLALVGRRCVYLDDDHLTDFGTWLAKPQLESAIDLHLPLQSEAALKN